MNRSPSGPRRSAGAAFATAFFVAAAAPLAAQTYTACRVPDVGAIYMIGVAGAPSACLDASHVQFSWIEGGQVANDAVGTLQIVDESVQSDDLAANSVGGAEIINGAVGLFDMGSNSVGPDQLGLEVVSATHALLSGGIDTIELTCPTGKRVISGGYRLNSYGAGGGDINVRSNGPSGVTGWTVIATWSTSNTWNWSGYAVCIIDGS